ncbi:unnamed protein product [Vitrella brassicaformis CCMP3155]|uniref:RING-CH-type domain-containing protein n=1 Tax=Vitrella brassicaformis (strain CCMP3155) TaxID=1169540 RepID=A0A0G4EAN8_VITBC|nr:unnamed protein product [Vitrella brassicaformis CCMP3155]|eukprot:CEL92708.1 unnamed protein product [Vitrella brassicaformis CCMP3155]
MRPPLYNPGAPSRPLPRGPPSSHHLHHHHHSYGYGDPLYFYPHHMHGYGATLEPQVAQEKPAPTAFPPPVSPKMKAQKMMPNGPPPAAPSPFLHALYQQHGMQPTMPAPPPKGVPYPNKYATHPDQAAPSSQPLPYTQKFNPHSHPHGLPPPRYPPPPPCPPFVPPYPSMGPHSSTFKGPSPNPLPSPAPAPALGSPPTPESYAPGPHCSTSFKGPSPAPAPAPGSKPSHPPTMAPCPGLWPPSPPNTATSKKQQSKQQGGGLGGLFHAAFGGLRLGGSRGGRDGMAKVTETADTREGEGEGDGEVEGERELEKEERTCRFCRLSEDDPDAADDGPLVAPCGCKGSIKWVHTKCLEQWIKTPAPGRSSRSSVAKKCDVCKMPYFYEGMPPYRPPTPHPSPPGGGVPFGGAFWPDDVSENSLDDMWGFFGGEGGDWWVDPDTMDGIPGYGAAFGAPPQPVPPGPAPAPPPPQPPPTAPLPANPNQAIPLPYAPPPQAPAIPLPWVPPPQAPAIPLPWAPYIPPEGEEGPEPEYGSTHVEPSEGSPEVPAAADDQLWIGINSSGMPSLALPDLDASPSPPCPFHLVAAAHAAATGGGGGGGAVVADVSGNAEALEMVLSESAVEDEHIAAAVAAHVAAEAANVAAAVPEQASASLGSMVEDSTGSEPSGLS